MPVKIVLKKPLAYRSNHAISDFPCEQCDYVTTTKMKLRYHIRKGFKDKKKSDSVREKTGPGSQYQIQIFPNLNFKGT